MVATLVCVNLVQINHNTKKYPHYWTIMGEIDSIILVQIRTNISIQSLHYIKLQTDSPLDY